MCVWIIVILIYRNGDRAKGGQVAGIYTLKWFIGQRYVERVCEVTAIRTGVRFCAGAFVLACICWLCSCLCVSPYWNRAESDILMVDGNLLKMICSHFESRFGILWNIPCLAVGGKYIVIMDAVLIYPLLFAEMGTNSRNCASSLTDLLSLIGGSQLGAESWEPRSILSKM